MCVPIDDDVSASRLGWHDADRGHRLRLVAESYGPDIAERAELLGLVDRSMQVGAEFVRRRADAGDPVPVPTMSIDDAIAHHSGPVPEDVLSSYSEFGDAAATVSARFETVEVEVSTPQATLAG